MRDKRYKTNPPIHGACVEECTRTWKEGQRGRRDVKGGGTTRKEGRRGRRDDDKGENEEVAMTMKERQRERSDDEKRLTTSME